MACGIFFVVVINQFYVEIFVQWLLGEIDLRGADRGDTSGQVEIIV